MQTTDIAGVQQGLEFFQSPVGLAVLLLIALMMLACVLLTILVVSLGASQRALAARAETANRLLAQIRERLIVNEAKLPLPHKRAADEQRVPPKRAARASRAGDRTDVFKAVDI